MGSMLTLHYARHGETIWHAGNRYAGHTDIPLTERGREQAKGLAAWAADAALDRVVASDLQRAAETARPSAAALGLEVALDPRFREIAYGQAEGLTQEETAERFPEARAAYDRAPATSPLPGAEVGTAAAARALEAVWDLTRTTADGRVLVVAHSGVGRLLFSALLGIPLNDYRRVFPWLENSAVTTLRLPVQGTTPDELIGTAQLLELNRPV
jgi:broad specificity phosphatase PhoE